MIPEMIRNPSANHCNPSANTAIPVNSQETREPLGQAVRP